MHASNKGAIKVELTLSRIILKNCSFKRFSIFLRSRWSAFDTIQETEFRNIRKRSKVRLQLMHTERFESMSELSKRFFGVKYRKLMNSFTWSMNLCKKVILNSLVRFDSILDVIWDHQVTIRSYAGKPRPLPQPFFLCLLFITIINTLNTLEGNVTLPHS